MQKLTNNQVNIEFDVSRNRDYNINMDKFGLLGLYNVHHIDVAARVYNAFLSTKTNLVSDV